MSLTCVPVGDGVGDICTGVAHGKEGGSGGSKGFSDVFGGVKGGDFEIVRAVGDGGFGSLFVSPDVADSEVGGAIKASGGDF